MSTKQFNKACTLLQLLVRLRAADESLMVSCVLCGKRVDYRDADGAHFIPRGYKVHALDIRNVNCACQECNRMDKFHQFAYSHWMLSEHGSEFVSWLHSTKRGPVKYSRAHLETMISDFREQIRAEESRLGLRSAV